MKLHIFGMQRSGQHAIINWLCEQNKPSLHFNACNQNKKAKNFIFEYKEDKKIKHERKKMPVKGYNLVIYNFEEQLVRSYANTIVVIREPRNWMASRIKSGIKRRGETKWIQHAQSKEYKILFDKWFVDENYRKKICSDFGLNFSDEGLNQVFSRGVSSFDRFDFDGEAQKMNVIGRWKQLDAQTRKRINFPNKRRMIKMWEKLYNES